MFLKKLCGTTPHVEEPDIAVSARHAGLLAQALGLMPDIIDTLSDEDWELAAVSLRTVIARLGDIVGEEADLDIYETIFSKFCIGK